MTSIFVGWQGTKVYSTQHCSVHHHQPVKKITRMQPVRRCTCIRRDNIFVPPFLSWCVQAVMDEQDAITRNAGISVLYYIWIIFGSSLQLRHRSRCFIHVTEALMN